MEAKEWFEFHEKLVQSGYGSEIDWAENLQPCVDSTSFFFHYLWVVCNSGMKNEIATKIYEKIVQAIADDKDISKVFNHKLKVKAIKTVLKHKEMFFDLFQNARDKISFLETIPHIGPITKYHLAKDLGVNTIKPDRHLVRIAKMYDTNPFDMCEKIAKETGYKLITVDMVLWRSANLGFI